MSQSLAARAGRPRIDAHNRRILTLLRKGYGRKRIWQDLRQRKQRIGLTTVGKRIRELRAADSAGRLAAYLNGK